MTIRSYQGKTPLLGERVFVDPSAVLVGDIEIGADSSVWPLVVIRGDMHRIRIGQRSSIQTAACCTSPTPAPSTRTVFR